MKKVVDFIKESIEEIRDRVSWPKYGELQNSSILVLVASIIFALIIGVVDYLFKNGMTTIYENF